MKIGYARVSTDKQELDLQHDALLKAGCEKIFSDKAISGMKRARPALDKCLESLGPADCLYVYKLDRLGRSLSHVIEIIESFKTRGVAFVSITEGFNTNTPSGQMIFHIIGALAQFERELIRERVNAGIQAAQSRGVHCGRRTKLTSEQIYEIKVHRDMGDSMQDIANSVGISRATVYRALKY